jgi:hypothetical protein
MIMKFRVGRIIIAAIAAEVLGILTLVVIVALFGPRDASAAQAYAESLGFWVGPISGFVYCLLGGFWVAKGLARLHVENGFVLGVAGAAIDVALLLAAGAPFQVVYLVANVGRIVAGTIGGWLAARNQREAANLTT